MSQPPRPPIHNCPVCKVAMLGSRSDEKSRGFDTFTCLQCQAVVTTLTPPTRSVRDKVRE